LGKVILASPNKPLALVAANAQGGTSEKKPHKEKTQVFDLQMGKKSGGTGQPTGKTTRSGGRGEKEALSTT